MWILWRDARYFFHYLRVLLPRRDTEVKLLFLFYVPLLYWVALVLVMLMNAVWLTGSFTPEGAPLISEGIVFTEMILRLGLMILELPTLLALAGLLFEETSEPYVNWNKQVTL